MSKPYGDAAQAYWRAGWANPIPVKGKDAPVSGYTGYEGRNVSWPDIQSWLEGEEASHNIALRLPGDIIGIDVDAYDGKVGDISIAAAEAELGPLPESARSTSRAPFAPSGIRFYRVPLNANLRGAEKRFRIRFGDHIDVIRRDHRYAVVWPSIHRDTGWTYRWYSPDGSECEIPRPADLPELPPAWLDFLVVPGATEPPPDEEMQGAPRQQESLWDQFAARRFTREQAREFVRPHLEALRAAPNGTINNRLNDAAIALNHFVPDFLSRAEAAHYLLGALEETMYDGKTWRAETTIASAFGAKTWRAEFVDETTAATDGRSDALAREVTRLHIQAEARDIFAAERHARTWSAPTTHGSLTNEIKIPDEETNWRFDGLLGAGHNAVLVAGRKVGKTSIINNLIRSYVDGEPFLNRFAVAAADAAIAVFNYEVDQRQYRRWIRDVGIVNTDRVFIMHLRGVPLPLRDAQVRTWVVRWLRERHVGLWLLDPYSRAYVGSLDNGNDEAQVGAFLDTLDVIKQEAGVSELVMPVHTPKARVEAGDETAIGSQRLEGWPDSMWYLTKDFESGLRFMRAEGRDVDVPEEQLTYDESTRRLALGGWDRASLRKQTDSKTIVESIRSNPGCSQNDLMAALQWGAQRVQKAIQAAGGRVRTTPGKGRTNHHYVDS